MNFTYDCGNIVVVNNSVTVESTVTELFKRSDDLLHGRIGGHKWIGKSTPSSRWICQSNGSSIHTRKLLAEYLFLQLRSDNHHSPGHVHWLAGAAAAPPKTVSTFPRSPGEASSLNVVILKKRNNKKAGNAEA